MTYSLKEVRNPQFIQKKGSTPIDLNAAKNTPLFQKFSLLTQDPSFFKFIQPYLQSTEVAFTVRLTKKSIEVICVNDQPLRLDKRTIDLKKDENWETEKAVSRIFQTAKKPSLKQPFASIVESSAKNAEPDSFRTLRPRRRSECSTSEFVRSPTPKKPADSPFSSPGLLPPLSPNSDFSSPSVESSKLKLNKRAKKQSRKKNRSFSDAEKPKPWLKRIYSWLFSPKGKDSSHNISSKRLPRIGSPSTESNQTIREIDLASESPSPSPKEKHFVRTTPEITREGSFRLQFNEIDSP